LGGPPSHQAHEAQADGDADQPHELVRLWVSTSSTSRERRVRTRRTIMKDQAGGLASLMLLSLAGPSFGGDHRGTADDDVSAGTHNRDVITAKQGDDELRGRGVADRLNGGRGSDLLVGGKGSDVLSDPIYVDCKQHFVTDADRYGGGPGADTNYAGINDVVQAGRGNDVVITAGGVNLSIDCGPGHDVVRY
jgi:RTX calcium-binding nonapeptide repeat (4 copies)